MSSIESVDVQLEEFSDTSKKPEDESNTNKSPITLNGSNSKVLLVDETGTKVKFIRKRMQSDGDCFYSAIAFCVRHAINLSYTVEALRKMAASEIEKNLDSYTAGISFYIKGYPKFFKKYGKNEIEVSDENIKLYLEGVRKCSSIWGSHLEAIALAKRLERSINIYNMMS